MKCLLCPAEIDEVRVIHPEDVHTRRTHGEELGRWKQVTVDMSNGGGVLNLLAGHVCPNESIQPGDITIVRNQ